MYQYEYLASALPFLVYINSSKINRSPSFYIVSSDQVDSSLPLIFVICHTSCEVSFVSRVTVDVDVENNKLI